MTEEVEGRENGVSPVIAALLILALTVLLTGVFALGMLSLGGQEPAPIAGITISDTNGVITLSHFSGDTLPAGEYKILVNGADRTADFQAGDVDFSPGSRLTWDQGVTHQLSLVSVVFTGGGRSVVIAEKKFYREGKGEANAAFSAVITEGKNATSQVKTGVSGTNPLPSVIADQADIWVVPDQGSDQVTIAFTADEEGSDLTFSWTSGNGQTASGRTADFVYDSAGSYTVRLDVLNTASGESGSDSMKISVRDPGLSAMTWVKRDTLVTGGFAARTTTGGIGLDRNSGGWAFQYNDPRFFGVEFKVVLTDSVTKSFNHVRSREEMVPGIWYHAAGVVRDSGTTAAETLRIYVNGTYPHAIMNEGDPTGMTYFEPVKYSDIYLNPSFTISSYSEVPFPLSGAEIAAIYAAERDDPR
ncbi:MAG: type IV pilin [Methanocorpusculum sp.]|uniref:type IV pilin n=1 Tax=Methanocorpusculum sp. TaxID=2058474 RepID=UPI002B20FC19|nr:type IV pilin [Methanocorpusculum sp.]MEA5086447.1 type IV pilin [Methanocorpusculum sp.]